MENGDIVLTSADPNNFTLEDVVVVIDRKTGKTKKEFNLYKIVSDIDSNLIKKTDITWAWINGLYYDKPNNELILSLRNMNSIVSLDYSSGKIKWILGDIKYWGDNFKQYIVVGEGSDFTYTLGQHSPKIDSNGNLMIFNNGYDAYHETSMSCSALRNNASYGMIYKIDRKNKKAEVLYKFGGKEYFSFELSSYYESYDGYRIFNSGWHFKNDDLYNDTTCTQFTNDKYNSYIIEFDKDNNKLVELLVDESKVEVEKALIYNLSLSSINPNKDNTVKNYIFDNKAYFTTNKDEEKYEVLSEKDALSYKDSEICPISFELINKQFALVGNVPEDFDFKVTFISPSGNAYKYTLKEVNKDLKLNINLSDLPNERYYVYVNMDDLVFDTRSYIEIQ